METVRVRYAPSPTGLQHIGGVRSALFNYLFARAKGGKFILRVEDTDRERYNEESLQDLYDTLNWMNIQWDEGPDKDGGYGPYTQSERVDIHKEYAARLLADGKAYPCFCTSERLTEMRAEQEKTKKGSGYDRLCRDIAPADAQKRIDAGEPYVLRLKIPTEGKVTFHDEILGDISRKTKDVNPDPVIVKTDGFPTYHLANVLDDHMMGITHVMRAQEWIPSTPLHVLLYEAFGWEPPKFCHLPMVMGKDGSKLSKRHGSTSVKEFRTGGYLPEAVTNYIALLGWSFDDSREFFTLKELEELFTLEKLNKAPAVFDYRKLEWFNGQYIRKTDAETLKEQLIPILQQADIVSTPITDGEKETLNGALGLIHERMKKTTDAPDLLRFIFKDISEWNTEDAIPKKMDAAATVLVLTACEELLAVFDENSDEQNEQLFRDKAEAMEIKLGQILQPLRVALSGTKVSPPLFESIRLLGTEKTIERVGKLKALLQ